MCLELPLVWAVVLVLVTLASIRQPIDSRMLAWRCRIGRRGKQADCRTRVQSLSRTTGWPAGSTSHSVEGGARTSSTSPRTAKASVDENDDRGRPKLYGIYNYIIIISCCPSDSTEKLSVGTRDRPTPRLSFRPISCMYSII